jgi:hypothetical protein
MGFYFRSIYLYRVGVLSGGFVFVLYLMSLDPLVPPLNTDCPEVIGLVNHSATVFVMVKVLIFNYLLAKRGAVVKGGRIVS